MRRNRLLLAILVLGVAMVATACGGDGAGTPSADESGQAEATSSTAVDTSAEPAEKDTAEQAPASTSTMDAEAASDQAAVQTEEVTIEIAGFSFAEAEVTVAPGTTITWVNKDAVAHTATSDDGAFDSGNFGKGESWSYTFEEPGEYPYHCAPHPFMTAKVIVKE